MTGHRAHAVRVGAARGWGEFRLGLKNPQDLGFYLFAAAGALLYLFWNRDDEVAGTSLPVPSAALPGILAMLVAFGAVTGPAYALAVEREDGTLLRARAVPHGVTGYVVGQVLLQTMQVLPMFAAILGPSLLLFDDLAPRGAAGWLTVLWATALGLAAMMPVGIVIGSLASGPQRVGAWGLLPVLALAGVSGVLLPMDALWGWVRTVAQLFPVYWLGLAMRSAFLPDAAAALEIGGSWRTWQAVCVPAAWAVAGMAVAPVVLRRAARRACGSRMAADRESAARSVR
jgi:ABC-2 type transport system permease protein